MGLASSQARLLCITMRINDDQYALLKLGAEQLSLSNKKADIADEYDYRKNAVNYSYNGNDQFTYSDLMGASGLTAGLDNPVFVTNSENKIVLDGAYGMAMQSAYLATSGKPKGSATGFNAFVAQITGDRTTDWYKASQSKATSTPATSGTNNTKGTSNNTTTKTQLTAEAQALRDKYDNARAYVKETYGQEPLDEQEWVSEITDADRFGSQNYRIAQDFEQERGYYEPVTNAKGYSYEDWNIAVSKYCASIGLDEEYVKAGANSYPAEANKTETITETVKTPNSSLTPNINAETLLDGSLLSTGKSGSINEDGTVNDEKTIKAAKYYLQIYNKACEGFVMDVNITNRNYMNAQLENNNLKIDGKLASENENLKKGLAKDVDDENEKIERWYKKEMQSTESEEKRISIKQTSIQADLSALQTEQSSVQSLIDKNIERSFTYCQNG